jgi:HlyD family secretion protein
LTRALLGAAASAAALGLGYAWRPKPIPVDMGTVTRGELVVAVEEVAKTRVRDRYVIAAPLAGSLLRIELRPGDRVEAGAVLARIAPMESPLLDPRSRAEAGSRSAAAAAAERQALAAVARAEVASKHADDELERTRSLVTARSLAEDALTRGSLDARLRREELASAKFGVQMAAHEAAMARAALARFGGTRPTDGFDVPAPITGTVLRVLSQNAGPVQPGTPLIEVGDPAALEVVTEVLSADAVTLTRGARATIERWGGAPLAGHVRLVEPSGFTRLSALGVEEQRVPVVIDLDERRERWAALGDGFRVEVSVVVEQKLSVLRAPIGAVFRHGDGWAAFVVEDGTARLRPVTLGARNDVNVEIVGGAAEGATIVVHPSERVKDAVKVEAR